MLLSHTLCKLYAYSIHTDTIIVPKLAIRGLQPLFPNLQLSIHSGHTCTTYRSKITHHSKLSWLYSWIPGGFIYCYRNCKAEFQTSFDNVCSIQWKLCLICFYCIDMHISPSLTTFPSLAASLCHIYAITHTQPINKITFWNNYSIYMHLMSHELCSCGQIDYLYYTELHLYLLKHWKLSIFFHN